MLGASKAIKHGRGSLSQSFVIHKFRFHQQMYTELIPHFRPNIPFHTHTLSLLLRVFLPGDERLAVARTDSHVGEDLRWSQVNGDIVCGLVGNLLLEFLQGEKGSGQWDGSESEADVGGCNGRTRLSKTHLLSFHSAGRHCQSC